MTGSALGARKQHSHRILGILLASETDWMLDRDIVVAAEDSILAREVGVLLDGEPTK